VENLKQNTIGVIVNAHNEELAIEDCLLSILSQRGCDFVLFVSDNNSTDSTTTKVLETIKNYSNTEFRSEDYPLKSVYGHALNSYEYFLHRNPQIEFWIILSADDVWIGTEFLSKLFKATLLSSNLGNCTYPSIKINSALSQVPKYITNNFEFSSALFRRIKYMLTPRSRQPLLFVYGVFNRPGFELLIEWFEFIENYRMVHFPQSQRVPEAEVFYSQKLIGKLILKSCPEAFIGYSIHHRKGKKYVQEMNLEGTSLLPVLKWTNLDRAKSVTRSICHMFFSMHKLWFTLKFSEKCFYLFLLPFNVLFELIAFLGQYYSKVMRK
jgi:glycosyltransferase involved in cell wall biosynthesis